ncbi:SDR family NAD(P)-dependent oxidoreductase [Candidatus Berkiella cookevillensis]|uniref:Putative oxidoreductase n=1 Tax=Candidatus Berkiella cookevillensis TaxID=437022 RepID=A0A0Q9YEG9_9GAMM|nr:SDR family NAD(P)-dependent oxidoreductase [Candidatus Berkiella cookevillensis]MCS5709295.1 SDR family NAD(P)-dependent oxidoreductase [Candidatus Berkiella cookevillensis]
MTKLKDNNAQNFKNSFKDKVILITGASSGIGAALAKGFAQEKAKLALLARRFNKLEVIASLCKMSDSQALALVCDVSKETEIEKAVATVQQQLGSIDVVIANAGFGVVANVENLTLTDFQRQFETNVYGVLRTLYATLDDLKKTQGRLVIIGSASGHISIPKYAAYAMSKHAITALAETLYAELAPYGISVTLISPGFVKTEIRNVNNLGIYQEGTRDPLPEWLRLDADKAAKIIIKAIRLRQRERIITVSGKLGVILNRVFPGLLPRFFRWQAMRKK